MGKRRKNRKNRANNYNNYNQSNYNGTSLALAKTDNTTETKTTATTTTEKSTYSWKSNKKNYDFKGNKNQTNFPEFVSICKPSQEELKMQLGDKLLEAGYTEIISGDGYVYAKGTIPVLLTAHMDTVHKENVKDFYEYYDEEKQQHIISSPQGIGGDDRCGIYMILEIIKTHKCSVLFCEDEESGGIGSDKFCKTEFMVDLENLKYLIELDRANGNDAVFYDCENDEFTSFIEDNTGFKYAWGSFSDISNLSPACGVASVNLSCGYYNAHSTSEYVIVEEMLNTIEVVKKLLDVECKQFEYIEAYSRYNGYGYGYGYGYGGYSYGKKSDSKSWYDSYDSYDDYYWNRSYSYGSTYNSTNKTENKKEVETPKEEKSLLIQIYIEEEGSYTYVANGKTEAEAFGVFFMNNPTLCFNDVYDYDWYDCVLCENGWMDTTF